MKIQRIWNVDYKKTSWTVVWIVQDWNENIGTELHTYERISWLFQILPQYLDFIQQFGQWFDKVCYLKRNAVLGPISFATILIANWAKTSKREWTTIRAI